MVTEVGRPCAAYAKSLCGGGITAGTVAAAETTTRVQGASKTSIFLFLFYNSAKKIKIFQKKIISLNPRSTGRAMHRYHRNDTNPSPPRGPAITASHSSARGRHLSGRHVFLTRSDVDRTGSFGFFTKPTDQERDTGRAPQFLFSHHIPRTRTVRGFQTSGQNGHDMSAKRRTAFASCSVIKCVINPLRTPSECRRMIHALRACFHSTTFVLLFFCFSTSSTGAHRLFAR